MREILTSGSVGGAPEQSGAPTRNTNRRCRRAVYADGTEQMYGRTACGDFVKIEGPVGPGIELHHSITPRSLPNS